MQTLPEPVQRVLLAAMVVGPVIVTFGTLIGTIRGNAFADLWQGGINVTGRALVKS